MKSYGPIFRENDVAYWYHRQQNWIRFPKLLQTSLHPGPPRSKSLVYRQKTYFSTYWAFGLPYTFLVYYTKNIFWCVTSAIDLSATLISSVLTARERYKKIVITISKLTIYLPAMSFNILSTKVVSATLDLAFFFNIANTHYASFTKK